MAKKKILLADDDAVIRLLVATTIEDEEYVLLEASNGRQALSIIQQEHPDLVLLDVNMPQPGEGIEVCRTIKSDAATKDTLVIMLTADAREADRQRAIAAGADHYFTKPFSPLELLRKLREYLGPREAHA